MHARIPAGGTPGYATLNMRLGRTFGCYDQHRLTLTLENLSDKNYLVHGSGVFGTGFTARLGYTWRYGRMGQPRAKSPKPRP